MAAKDNVVYSTTQQFCKNFSVTIPETVLYGYAKLLLMEEASIRSLLSDAEIADLNGARKVVDEHKLDLNLIRSGLLLLIPYIQLTDQQKNMGDIFSHFLLNCKVGTSSAEIIQMALENATLPVGKVFAMGESMDSVFEYQKDMKRNAALTTKQESKNDTETKEQERHTQQSEEMSGETQKQKKNQVSKEPKEESSFLALSEQYRHLSSALFDVVKGQDHAVGKFVQGCFQGELLKQSEKGKHPRSYFFFFGPPGVGKTLLAETAAEELKRPHMFFNMSEYSSPSSVDELIGTSKVYNNSREGSLVKFVRENPECILIFDEIEKAHIMVIRLFLQILGSGKLHNVSREEDTSFADTIIIFTSNVGKELYADRSVNLTTLPERVILDSIRNDKNSAGIPMLPEEICSRIASGNMILFNHLSVRHLTGMIQHNFEKISTYMSEEYGCHITYSAAMPLLFLYHRGGELDARVASRQSGSFLKNEIYELTRQIENYRAAKKGISSIHFDIEWDGVDEELQKLFVNDVKTEVLLMVSDTVKEHLKVDEEKYKLYFASTVEEAREYLKQDITAAFIDPLFGKHENNENILSVTDYDTEGVDFFHELAETQTGLPIYLLETDRLFSEIDRRSFLQEGAADTLSFDIANADSFVRYFRQILDEVYMEKESCAFSQKGWVIDFKSKQDVSEEGKIKILFYDLKKRMAVDVESRETLLSEAERPKVKFEDVIGAEKAKEELSYFIEYLKNPKRFLIKGHNPPKGVLLYGPPGTGKTMLAEAMAGESDVTFIKTSAADLKNMYVGESEANIRRLFKKAARYAPAIIFIDEIDAIGKKRTGSESAHTTESMLNALLTQMDGFGTDNRKPIFVLAATNYGVGSESDGISSLDEALIRRFDNKIYVDLPNEAERKKYLTLLIGKRSGHKISEQVIANIAERTTGQSLAILQNVVELTFRNVEKENREVEDNDLLNSLEDYMYGEKRESKPDYYREVAIHETGHAYVSYISGDVPSYITIEARGKFGGYMQHGNSEDIPNYTKEELLSRIRTSLAGRAAEQVFYGRDKALNTGASSDLKQATNLAFHIVCTYGMIEGQLITLSKEEILKSAVAGEYIAKINEILNQEMEKTIALIEEGKDIIQKIVERLLVQNHLTGGELKEIMEK